MPSATASQFLKMENEVAHWINADVGFNTLSVHGGQAPDVATGAILTPIYASTTYIQPSVEQYLAKGYSYTRQDNPTVRALERRIAAMEGGKDCICVSSGMAATVTVFSAFLKAGDHCVITESSYGGTNRCARVHFSKYNIAFSFVDFRDTTKVEAAILPNTRMIFSESPSNPVLRLADVQAISDIAHRHTNVLHVCDSTFATPLIMRPIELGADLVIQSTTKFYDGHNISVGGAIIVANAAHRDTLSLQRNILGCIMTPAVAFFTAQTTKTLPLRVARQCATALTIAQFLETHPKVTSVRYPGLMSYPQRELARKQHKNNLNGSMVTFDVSGGTENGKKLMNTIKRPWSLCENLGACESIITCPAVFTHANMLRDDRLRVGVTDGLIRLSCGLEDPEDLKASLKEALDNL